MNSRIQDDFTCLNVAIANNSSSSHALGDYEEAIPRSCKTNRPEKRPCCDETYVPVNFINNEVYALIAAWEASEFKREESGEAADSALDADRDALYEPLRCRPTIAPPKRFYRTFWKSITRRTLENARKSVASHRLEIERSESERS